jgi:hypothetical protein
MYLREVARKFREQKPGEDVTEEMKTALKGMVPPPNFEFKSPIAPVFTVLNDNNAKNLYADSFFVLYLNIFLPFRELYERKSRAGMGFVHMLAVPRERIYNAAFLEPEDALLLEYMRKKVKSLVDDREFRLKVMDDLLAQFMAVNDCPDSVKTQFESFTTTWLNKTDGSDIDFCFHMHPYNSVGHLHMHCYTSNMRTNFAHENHNFSFDVIMEKLSNTY